MSFNKASLNGRLPFDIEVKGTEGKEVVVSKVSVKRNYKPEGDQYYPEDLIPFKIFSGKAKFFGTHFGKGKSVILEGELRIDSDWEKDGVSHKGEMYLHVTEVYFPEGNSKDGGESAPAAPAKPAAGKPAAKAPVAGAPKKNPFAK
jgi:single-stranded DNA-binding protein